MATITHAGTAVWTTAAGNKTFTGTPVLNDLIVIIAPATGVATSSVTDNNSDGNGTYTKIGSSFTGFSTAGDLSIWVRNSLIGSATSTIFTATQTSSTGGGLDVYRVSGMTRTGAAAVRSHGGQSTGTAATTPAPVLGLVPSTNNPIITAVCNGTSPAGVTIPSGYTAAPTNLGYTVPTTGLTDTFVNSGVTSATITWGGTSATAFASIAIELDASASGVVPGGWTSPVGIRAIYVRTGNAMASVIPSAAAPPAPPVTPFYPFTQAVRARTSANYPRAGSITNENSAGTGNIGSPVQGAGFGNAQGANGAPVRNPNPGPQIYPLRNPVQANRLPLRPGRVFRSAITVSVTPQTGPLVYPLPAPVRARLPQLHPRAGTISFNAGGPVHNPVSGPVFIQKPYPVKAKTPLFRTGRVELNTGAPVRNPASGPVFVQAAAPIRARIPQTFSKGRIGSSPGAPVHNPVQGPVFVQKPYPVQARQPLPRRGRMYGISAGAPVHNPGSGPVFRQLPYPVKSRQPLPLRGRISFNLGTLFIPPVVTVTVQRRNFIRAQAPLPRRGICRSIKFYPPVSNPVPGPPVYPLQGPVRARQPLPPRGRIASNKGGPVTVPGSGPVFRPFRFPVRIHPALPPRGRIASNKGVIQNATSGPVFTQKTSPVRIRVTLPLRGRISSAKGAPVTIPASGPVFYPKNFAKAQLPLPRRGVCRAIRFYPLPVNPPQSGPPVYPLQGPVRVVFPPLHPRAGRVYSNPGIPVNNPGISPTPAWALTQPVGVRVTFLAAGRMHSTRTPGAIQNQVQGPAFIQQPYPARIRITLPIRGRIASGKGAPVQNPTSGPVFRQRPYPVKARQPLPSRGRIASNPGGPVVFNVAGPVFIQKPYPARIRPVLPPRGRISFNAGAPVHNSQLGPVFRQFTHPVQQRIPQVFSKGRVYSNSGAPVQNPSAPPPVYPLHGPVQARHPLPPRGRITRNPGGPVLNPPAPVYPLHGPVRSHTVLPSRGRAASNKGNYTPPGVQPPIYPLQHPIQARRPLPPRGRIGSNNGALVRNPQKGPVFRQATQPIRVRIPQNAPRGRTSSNPGGPVENIPLSRISFTLGVLFTLWTTEDLSSRWDTGVPLITSWGIGNPYNVQ